MCKIDLPALETITLGDYALRGNEEEDSCSLTMCGEDKKLF